MFLRILLFSQILHDTVDSIAIIILSCGELVWGDPNVDLSQTQAFACGGRKTQTFKGK